MAKIKRLPKWIIGILVMAYVVIALTPLKATIGRYSPSAASLFSPASFNFSHIYTSGNVLEFSVGMTRNELFETLIQNYSGRADLTVNCVVTTADAVVPITSALDIAAIYGGGDRLCARLDSGRLGFFVDFENELVSRIKIVFVRNELP